MLFYDQPMQRSVQEIMRKFIIVIVIVCAFRFVSAQPSRHLEVNIDTNMAFQTIHNFGASDAWAAQFVGKWPGSKRNKAADWLFSMEFDNNGSPKGIGLSAWRFNIGAGSVKQGEESGIKDPWRRAEGFLQHDGSYNWKKQAGQQWFLGEAKKRGVDQFVAFVNSPPIQLTKNIKAHSDDGLGANLSPDNYNAYANFLSKVLLHFKDSLGIDFEYVSPFNEPQWEWKGGQEGSPWNNEELANASKVIDSVFVQQNINTKIEITEAGQIDYLTGKKEKHENRSDQIETFFNLNSPHYLGNLSSLAPKVAGHSYFTTWDVQKLKRERARIAEKLLKYPSLEYWMSEYCILENNDEIRGKGKDLGMGTALYVARVVHADLTIANASAWHWWLAMSPYDFKDGLIYHDKNVEDGTVSDSKLLWALGNYSRFIRPGAKRILTEYKDFNEVGNLKDGVLASTYKNTDSTIVCVIINQKNEVVDLKLNIELPINTNIKSYVTNKSFNLHKLDDGELGDGKIQVLGKSVTTVVLKPGLK